MDIFLTLDYELFLGAKTGTPENCLIKPMAALCEALEKHGVRFSVFVDAAYLLRLSQLSDKNSHLQKDFDLVSKNVKSLHDKGHDIQLHFHPQWLYSDWDESSKTWKLDYVHYKLSDMPVDEAIKYFNQAKILLETITGKKIIAFRAGGYCLESFKDYIRLFKENGILVDSSVARGKYNLSGIHYFDYREVPSKHQIYKFSDSIREEVEDGRFIEAPISYCKWNKLYYLRKMRRKIASYKPTIAYGDGISIGNSIEKQKNKRKENNSFLSRFAPFASTASTSGITSVWLDDMYRSALKNHWNELVLIGHPKEENDCSIANLERFVSAVCKKEQFKTISDLVQ